MCLEWRVWSIGPVWSCPLCTLLSLVTLEAIVPEVKSMFVWAYMQSCISRQLCPQFWTALFFLLFCAAYILSVWWNLMFPTQDMPLGLWYPACLFGSRSFLFPCYQWPCVRCSPQILTPVHLLGWLPSWTMPPLPLTVIFLHRSNV